MNRRESARRAIEARVYRDAVGEPPRSRWRSIGPLLTEQGYAARVIRKQLGLHTPLNTEDRRVLEEVIFPFYQADSRFKTVLFVGCNTYTSHYEREFFAGRNYWTIEPDPDLRKFGAGQHVIAPLEEVARHFAANFFDLIICNGILGWGLDRTSQCERAFAQCYDCLRDDGHLVFGWDDIPRRTPFDLDAVPSIARYKRFVMPPFGAWRYLTDTPYRHTFDFYRKSPPDPLVSFDSTASLDATASFDSNTSPKEARITSR
jgi:SAM-dependent methyltransferase